MRCPIIPFSLLFSTLLCSASNADFTLLKTHCGTCHSGAEPEGDFDLASMGNAIEASSLEYWLNSLDRVKSGEMPPEENGPLADDTRAALIRFLQSRLNQYKHPYTKPLARPRRMNNREFSNSIADVLLIEDAGTHLPTDNLLGDSLYHGFDTHGETLGFSKFHLEEYIDSVRKIVDATILTGRQPRARTLKIRPEEIVGSTTSQNTRRAPRSGRRNGFDFLDPRSFAYFEPFKTTPASGWYRIKIRVIALDRGRYDEADTGMYDADPIRLKVILGDRERTFDLPDDEVKEIEMFEWLAEGTRLRLQHPTDGLRLLGNGNFKFQNRITAYYFKKYEPQRYKELVATFPTKLPNGRIRKPDDWHNWVDYWMGPRPRILGATVEGPIYHAWPPERQVALLGQEPNADQAAEILRPIARRAWRRNVRSGELDGIVSLVLDRRKELGDVGALKEGVVALLVSPEFLLLNREDLSPSERFASKLSAMLGSTIPSSRLGQKVSSGQLNSYAGVRQEVGQWLLDGRAEPFLQAFPAAWLELNDINFMSPDPDYFRHYHRKLVSDDMVGEVRRFFRHAIEQNVSLPEMISADYSFINADLAKIYGVTNGPMGSTFEKYVFADKRRGGLLGMGAFLTSTADSLSTSPIHRAIYVMENFLGIHPAPPPADVEITEPDVRQAKTIKEILEAHRKDANCAACHKRIDPFGYAFENFGPDGSWRESYTVRNDADSGDSGRTDSEAPGPSGRFRLNAETIPIDPSAEFLSGSSYRDIVGYREIMNQPANRERFVRCFVTKLLTYANGVEPRKADFAEMDQIVAKSAEHDYGIVDTISAVIDSPLFRETR